MATAIPTYVEGPRLYTVTESDHGPLVLVASYIFLSLMLLSKLARVTIKISSGRQWELADSIAMLAMVCL
jgi:hypothetical protein